MSRLLVVGGTGLAGRAVTAEAIARGHDVVVAARRIPDATSDSSVDGARYVATDIVAGDGLEEAVEGVDVLIDTTNGTGRGAGHVFGAGSLNLLHTAARFGVSQTVLLSIVNVDRSAYRYYRAKAAQERSYRESHIPSRILRTTQFHDFVSEIFRRGSRLGIIPAPARIRFQPIAVSDVARLLVDVAEEQRDDGAIRTAGGPAIETSRSLAERWKASRGSRAPIVPVPLGGALGSTLRAGENLVPYAAIDGVRYEDWLTASAVSARDPRAAAG
ncbi:MAG TPA: NAD(P)H-binding protein [Leifsonia sp.]|jgi:uncharacterized protein YbjT (DUF2867 family)